MIKSITARQYGGPRTSRFGIFKLKFLYGTHIFEFWTFIIVILGFPLLHFYLLSVETVAQYSISTEVSYPAISYLPTHFSLAHGANREVCPARFLCIPKHSARLNGRRRRTPRKRFTGRTVVYGKMSGAPPIPLYFAKYPLRNNRRYSAKYIPISRSNPIICHHRWRRFT